MPEYAETMARDEISAQYPTTKVAAAATLYAAGEIERDFFLSLCTDFLTAARSAVAVKVEALLYLLYKVDPVGFVPRDFSARDRASLVTILEHGDRLPQRVQEFSVITLDQFQRDTQIEIGAIHGATHWRWKTNNDSCPECQIQKNRVFEISEMMRDHPFCDCRNELMWRK